MNTWIRVYLAGSLGTSAGLVAATHWSVWLGAAIIIVSGAWSLTGMKAVNQVKQ